MTLDVFLRLLKKQLIWFILIPCLTAVTAWYVTKDEPKVYVSQATLYTGLASRYTLLTDKLGSGPDRSASAFDNLLTTLGSKETLLQVGVSLLADHLSLQQPDSLVLGVAGFEQLEREIPLDLRLQLIENGDDPASLRATIDSLSKTPTDNPIKKLLLTSATFYSIQTIGAKLVATARKNTNDVLQMEYEAEDPAVAQRTLHYAIDFLNKRHALLKTSETNSVVSYYEIKLRKAKEALDRAEADLRAFNVRNKVLDYDEEARTVASSREALISEYNQELGRRNAAKASLDALSRRMGQQGGVRNANNDLAEKQKKLSDAEAKLANARAYGQPKNVLAKLQATVAQLSDELKTSAQRYDAAMNTSESVPQQTISADLLAKNLEYEESSARIELYKKRIDEYKAKTDSYSPLGSQLRQLKRQLNVAETEYLSLLQNVDQSRTRRQDVSVGGTLEIMDAPNFPLEPKPSKRSQLIMLGFGVGIFLALLLAGIRFLVDKRIYSPEQAEALIEMPITAVFPTVKKPGVLSNTTVAAKTMFEQLVNAINIELAQITTKPYPPIITLFSIRSKQGKTWVAHGLNRLYANANQHVAYCYPRVNGKEQRETKNGVTYYPYTIRPDFMNVTSVDYLVDHDLGFDATQYDRIILELPALFNNQIPVYLLNSSALSLLVVDADSPWTRAEKQLLSLYVRVTKQPILTVLNRVEGSYANAVTQAEGKQVVDRTERSLQS
ncbi:GumC family protein [Spirosoma rigui]|uniref:GumC family protein n=1 Tax=Spirosoma rigui TaxID=564064 RepID=UPI0009B1AADF|nr:lipopolysaccharide biosynthesis protein [Spirosoma rigui]